MRIYLGRRKTHETPRDAAVHPRSINEPEKFPDDRIYLPRQLFRRLLFLQILPIHHLLKKDRARMCLLLEKDASFQNPLYRGTADGMLFAVVDQIADFFVKSCRFRDNPIYLEH